MCCCLFLSLVLVSGIFWLFVCLLCLLCGGVFIVLCVVVLVVIMPVSTRTARTITNNNNTNTKSITTTTKAMRTLRARSCFIELPEESQEHLWKKVRFCEDSSGSIIEQHKFQLNSLGSNSNNSKFGSLLSPSSTERHQ